MTIVRLPHMRGDEPIERKLSSIEATRLPHMRGDEPVFNVTVRWNTPVCPTCVGMNRSDIRGRSSLIGVCPACVGMNRIIGPVANDQTFQTIGL